MQTGTRQNIGDFVTPQHRAERFQLLNDISNEIRVTIDAFRHLDGSVAVVDTASPVDDGLDGNVKSLGDLAVAPAPDGTNHKDFKSFAWQVMRAFFRVKSSDASILDGQLLFEKIDFGSEPVIFDS